MSTEKEKLKFIQTAQEIDNQSSIKDLAQQIVNAWNNKLDDETQEEFEDRLKEKEEKE